MCKVFRTVLAILICVGASLEAKATVVATWTFDSGSDTTNPFDATSQSINVTSASLTVASVNGGMISHQTTGGNPNGRIRIAGNGQDVNGSVLTFQLQTSGATFAFSSLTFDYNRADSGKSPNNINWSYSITGGGSGSLGSSTLSATGWRSDAPVTLSSITLTPGQTLTITGTITGPGTGNPGDLSFDNFTFNSSVTPIPEPIHLAMGIFGLIFVTAGAGRFYLARVRRA